MASFVGRRWGSTKLPGTRGKKSLQGSAAFLAVAVAIGAAVMAVYAPGTLGAAETARVALFAGVAAAAAEAYNSGVDDNFLVPVVAAHSVQLALRWSTSAAAF